MGDGSEFYSVGDSAVICIMVWEWLWPNSSEGVRLSATREIALNFASVTLSTGFVAEDFCEIEVQKGDWLHDIGRRYNVDVRYCQLV